MNEGGWAILNSISEQDFRDPMRSDARTGNPRMTMWFRRRCDGSAIGQDDDRALGIEKPDDVVVIGDEAAPMRDVAQTGATEREQLLALGDAQVRKDIRDPTEAIANWRALVGCAGGKSLLQRGLWDEAFGIQSLIPEKQIVEGGEKTAVACRQSRVIPALELTLFLPIALRQLVKRRTGCVVDEGMLHVERIENVGFQKVGEGLTGDSRHDHRQQHIVRVAVGAHCAGREV